MTTIPTLEMLAEQAEARGQVLGVKDKSSGQYISEADARKHIADLVLLYMVFVYEEGDDEEIYTDYIRSEFMLGYTFSFYTPSSQNI